MTLGDYYTRKKWQEDDNVFIQQKQQIYETLQKKFASNFHKADEFTKLQKYLKSIYYPTTINTKSKDFIDLIQQAYIDIAYKVLEDFSWDNKLKIASPDNPYQIISDQKEIFEHKQQIRIDTIRRRLDQVKNKTIQFSQPNHITPAGLEEIEKGLKDLQTEFEILLKDYGKEGKTYITFNHNEGLKEKIEQLDQLYQAMSGVSQASPNDYGAIFELSLGLLSDEMAEDFANKSVNNIVKKFKEGSTTYKGNALTGGNEQVLSVETVINDEKGIVNIENKNNVETLKFGDLTITSQPITSRQGKIDIQLNLNNQDSQNYKNPFRISAKNVGKSAPDFGTTNLWYALSRTIDATSAEHLLYRLGNKNTLNSAHELIKFSILVDGLVGYSQRNNWVDTLVINYRQKKTIIVESIIDLVKDAYNAQKGWNKVDVTFLGSNMYDSSKQILHDLPQDNRSIIFKMQMIDMLINKDVYARYKFSNDSKI